MFVSYPSVCPNCRCFGLSGHTAVSQLIEDCGYLLLHNNTATTEGNCTLTCSEAMTSAVASLGCCVSALLDGSLHEELQNSSLWEMCGVEEPGECSRCSAMTTTPYSTTHTLTWGAVVAALSGLLLLQ